MNHSPRAVRTAPVVGAAVAAGALVTAGLVAVTGLSALVAYVLAFGLITFATYGFDKLRAIRGGRRVPNAALRLMSVLGGALGGWAGMVIWRHKINHPSFWLAQVAGTIAIVAALVLL